MNQLVQSFKRLLKNIFRPLYKKVINKLRDDFDINEQLRLAHHTISQIEIIKNEQSDLKTQVNTCNVFLTGIPKKQNELYAKMNIYTEEMNEILKTLNTTIYSDISVINYINILKNINLKGKTVLLIGAKNNLFIQEINKLGVKKIKRIEATPYYNLSKENDNLDITYVFPTQLDQVYLDSYDVLIIPDKYFSSLIIKNNLPFLGLKIREMGIFNLDVKDETIYQKDPEPELFKDKDNYLISFNDNYARKKIHTGGFFEVCCLYTCGNNINNHFDKKVTQFNYLKGYKIINISKKSPENFEKDNELVSEKIYIAYKLPQSTS